MKKYLLLSLTLFGSISYAMPGKEDCDQELHNAIAKINEAAVRSLLDNGADANYVQATSGMPPLQWAITWENEAAVNLLLDHGADINSQDRLGFTPLHGAVVANHETTARLLLEKGSNPLIQNVIKNTPLDSAKSDTIRELIKNEISKRRATMIWTLKGVHHAGPQAGQKLEQEDGLPALSSLPPEIVEKVMLKADPTLKRILIRNYIERKLESFPFDLIDFSDIIQRFEANFLDDISPVLDKILP